MKLLHVTLQAALLTTTIATSTFGMQPAKNEFVIPIIKFDSQNNLQQLNLSESANEVTDELLQSIAQNYPDLKSLNLLSCKRITNVGITHLAHGCKHLQCLDIRGCTLVNGVGLISIARECHELQELKIDGCPINNPIVRAIAQSCPDLRHLCCSGCPSLTGVVLQYLVHYCKKLEYLDISHNPRISNADLENNLVLGCPDLQILCVYRCPKVTKAGIIALQEARRFVTGVIGTVVLENNTIPLNFK